MAAIDKVKNRVQADKGRAKKAVGRATSDRSLEAEGQVDQVAGDLKQAGEKVKDALKR